MLETLKVPIRGPFRGSDTGPFRESEMRSGLGPDFRAETGWERKDVP